MVLFRQTVFTVLALGGLVLSANAAELSDITNYREYSAKFSSSGHMREYTVSLRISAALVMEESPFFPGLQNRSLVSSHWQIKHLVQSGSRRGFFTGTGSNGTCSCPSFDITAELSANTLLASMQSYWYLK